MSRALRLDRNLAVAGDDRGNHLVDLLQNIGRHICRANDSMVWDKDGQRTYFARYQCANSIVWRCWSADSLNRTCQSPSEFDGRWLPSAVARLQNTMLIALAVVPAAALENGTNGSTPPSCCTLDLSEERTAELISTSELQRVTRRGFRLVFVSFGNKQRGWLFTE